ATNSSLFNIPKLAEDGSNWITYKERTLTAIGARGLMRFTNGQAYEPAPFALHKDTKTPIKADGTAPSPAEIDELEKKVDEYHQKNALVKQQIFSMITDWLLLRVQNLYEGSDIWAEICQIH
ncbi:hypothetical protein DFJ58DRAFT_635001, partial [Suillus subalutaceus]|uniref:uncharacterized protein n=1 Tax=Suillus subalutaceus TaxID=48586 RepID=UPI001B86B142